MRFRFSGEFVRPLCGMDWRGNVLEQVNCETMGKESDNETGVSLQSEDVAWYDDLAKLVRD